MVQALLTRKGKEKEAAAMAGGQPLVLAHMAFGDGDYAATGGETALRNEIERKPIHTQGVVDGKPNVSFFKARLEEADGPYTIREIGLLDNDGDLIAIATLTHPLIKPDPDVDVRAINLTIHVAFSDLENMVIRVESTNAYISAQRKIDTGKGLKGGGDLAEDRTFELDIDGLETTVTAQIDTDEDSFAIHRKSKNEPEKISPSELAKALGVIALAQAVGDLSIPSFATDETTVQGESETKVVHPSGVKAAIDAALKDRRHIEHFMSNF